jgi:DNA-binding MarR family transcriptional regulator
MDAGMDAGMDDLVQLSFAVTGVLTRVAAGHDLSLTLLRLLAILRDRRPRMAEVAAYLDLEKSTVSGLVGRAEGRGLVERLSSPDDGREVRLSLTDDGRALARDIQAEVEGALAPLVADLTTEGRSAIRALVAQVARAG